MSIATLVLGNSGSGKSTSLRNLDPAKTLTIQCIKKPLPFKSTGFQRGVPGVSRGNLVFEDNPASIEKLMRKSPHDVVVIDDYQAVLINELLARSSEKGYDKFTDIAKSAWHIFKAAADLAEHRRVYIMAHTKTDEYGQIRMMTVGKMVDSMIVPEGYFTIVLRADVVNNVHFFHTQSNGQDCCKSPISMFDDITVPNDLNAVDASISSFYDLTTTA